MLLLEENFVLQAEASGRFAHRQCPLDEKSRNPGRIGQNGLSTSMLRTLISAAYHVQFIASTGDDMLLQCRKCDVEGHKWFDQVGCGRRFAVNDRLPAIANECVEQIFAARIQYQMHKIFTMMTRMNAQAMFEQVSENQIW